MQLDFTMAANPKSKTRNQKSVVLGVTGSIAASKSAELASLLVKQHHNVFVVMTADATEFITPLTLQTLSKNPVTTFLRRKRKLASRSY
jgi:phosphopantothenoylcysteine synthetase/decarboxylase